MYSKREGGSKAEISRLQHPQDSQRLKDAVDKRERSSLPSTSRGLIGKDNDRLSMLSGNGKRAQEQKPTEESETNSEESDVSGSDGEDTSWISWFCNLRGNEFFCEVDDDYI